MSQYMVVKLPRQKGLLLKEMARLRKKTIVDVIGDMLAGEIAAGRLADIVPGTDIRALKDGFVRFLIDGTGFPVMRPSDARAAATAIDEVVKSGGKSIEMGDNKLIIANQGTSVVIADGGDFRRVVARSVATDLARHLRAAADKAEALHVG